MAKGSHSTYGGWETRHCYHCGRTLTLKDAAMSSMLANGATFTLCNQTTSATTARRTPTWGQPGCRQRRPDIHPDQLELTDAP